MNSLALTRFCLPFLICYICICSFIIRCWYVVSTIPAFKVVFCFFVSKYTILDLQYSPMPSKKIQTCGNSGMGCLDEILRMGPRPGGPPRVQRGSTRRHPRRHRSGRCMRYPRIHICVCYVIINIYKYYTYMCTRTYTRTYVHVYLYV